MSQKTCNCLNTCRCATNEPEHMETSEYTDRILNQTDDFASGCSPFKIAASKAVGMQMKQNPRKKAINKGKLNRGRNVKITVETSVDSKSERFDSTKKDSTQKVCEICKGEVDAEEHAIHILQCLKRKYSRCTNTERTSPECVLCQVCQFDITSLDIDQRNAHVNSCIDKSSSTCSDEESKRSPYWETESTMNTSFFCEFCKQNIKHLNAVERITHKNQCVDQSVFEKELKKKVAVACEKAKKQILDCPICGQAFKTLNSRKNHLKKCAVKYNISTNVLMERVKNQDEEHQKMIIKGHFPVDIDEEVKPVKKVRKPRSSGKKESQNTSDNHSKRNFEEDTRLALALSSSMKDVDCPHKNMNFPAGDGSKDAFSIIMTPKNKDLRRRKNKQKICLEKLPLLIQNEEEMYSKLEQKVNAVILSQEDEYKFPLTPQFKVSHLQDELELDNGNKISTMWEKTAMKSILKTNHQEMYYVQVLMPPLTFCDVKAGSKLKHMSNIAGWQSSDLSLCEKKVRTDQVSSKSVPFLNDTTMVPSTQTAVMLAELAQDHSTSLGQVDKSIFLNQTGFFEETSENASDEKKKINYGEEEKALVNDFAFMVDNTLASDLVIITSEDKIINAHKFILAARCTRMLQFVENSQLQLSQFSYQSVLVLMRYLYAGICTFKKNLAFEVKELALRFSMDNLWAICNAVVQEMYANRTRELYDNKQCMNPDKTLQNILKEAWGSDSDDNSEAGDNEYINDTKSYKSEEEYEELYEFMTSQRNEQCKKKLSVIDEENEANPFHELEVLNDSEESNYDSVSKTHVKVDEYENTHTEDLKPKKIAGKERKVGVCEFDTDVECGTDQLEYHHVSTPAKIIESSQDISTSNLCVSNNEILVPTSDIDGLTNSQNFNKSECSDILDSRVNEKDIIAMLDDVSDLAASTRQGYGHIETDQKCQKTEQSKLSVAFKDKTSGSLKQKSPFKEEDSVDKSIIDKSCDDLFDSFSEGHLSHLNTPANTKSSPLDKNLTKTSVVLENQNYSLNSTPSPVFEHLANSFKNESSSAKQNLCSKFNVTNNQDSILETNIKTPDNFNGRKRKWYELDSDSSIKPTQKYRKQHKNPEGKEPDLDYSTILSNKYDQVDISSCNKIDYMGLKMDKCIDLTLSDDSDESEKDASVKNKACEIKLKSNESTHNSKKYTELRSLETYGNSTPLVLSPNEDVWDDFQDNGFDQDFICEAQDILTENEIITQENSAGKKSNIHDISEDSPSRKSTHSKSNAAVASCSTDVKLQHPVTYMPKEEMNSMLDQDSDISMYDPPTDISTNISMVFNAGDESIADESTNKKKQVTPKTTPVGTKKRKKSISKWIPPSPFTPMPNYDDMNTPQLQRQVKNMGVRIMPKKKMVTLLKNIYQESHAYETDPEFDSESVEAGKKQNEIRENVANDTSNPKGTKNVMGKRGDKQKCNSDKNTTRGKAKKKFKEPVNTVMSFSSSENESVSNEEIPEETLMQSSQEPKLSKRDVEFKRKQLWDSIKADDDLMLKILHYETIDLENFQQQLKMKGLKNIGTNVISEFLDDKTIPFTNRSQNKTSYGKKKTKKRDLAKE